MAPELAKEAVARPAATIVLLRDGALGSSGANLEVFMVVRHHAIDFAAGALVFPGGRVEESDFALARNAALCPNPGGLDTEAWAFRLAAIRETFEECGVLFARHGDSAALIEWRDIACGGTHASRAAGGGTDRFR
jgi:8-oxo-dGTP pyrophosphatase MutT (NUDIX family)